jgi:hypothetical protein
MPDFAIILYGSILAFIAMGAVAWVGSEIVLIIEWIWRKI